MTGGAVREILNPTLSVLALGGLVITLIAVSGVALIIMAVYAFWKMRSDDFWEEQD